MRTFSLTACFLVLVSRVMFLHSQISVSNLRQQCWHNKYNWPPKETELTPSCNHLKLSHLVLRYIRHGLHRLLRHRISNPVVLRSHRRASSWFGNCTVSGRRGKSHTCLLFTSPSVSDRRSIDIIVTPPRWSQAPRDATQALPAAACSCFFVLFNGHVPLVCSSRTPLQCLLNTGEGGAICRKKKRSLRLGITRSVIAVTLRRGGGLVTAV